MPPKLLFYSLVFLALCVGLPLWSQWQRAVSLRAAAWEQQQADKRLLTELSRPVKAAGQELTLREFVAFLQEQLGQPIVLDEEALDAAAVGLGARRYDVIHLPEGTVTCRSLLASAAEQNDLAFDIDQGRLRITTPERAESPAALLLNVYPIPQPGLTASTTEDEWVELVSTTIQPDTWDEVGGIGYLQSVPGGLAIVQTRDVHDEIRSLFVRLGEMENPPRSWASVPLSPPEMTAGERRIRQALHQTTSINVMLEPLNDLIANLASKHGFPAILHVRRLGEAGVGAQTPVTLKLKDVTVASVLGAIVEQLELTYIIRNEMVVITTPEEAEKHLPTVAYPVHDLVTFPEVVDFDSLTDLITTTVAPDSWDEVGGPGALTGSGIARGWMIVSQTDKVHREVEALLANIRRALSDGGPGPFPLGPQSAVDLKIRDALEREVAFDYERVAIADVCDELSQSLGINVRLDAKWLEAAGINVETPITCHFPRARVRVQLRRLCDALEMDFLVRSEALWLTTPEEAQSNLITRIYDVRPLIDPDIGITDVDGLQELITSHLQPDQWDEVGGPGSFQIFRGLAVVSQTEETHRQVRDMLLQLENHCLPYSQPAEPSPSVVHISADPIEHRIEAALSQRFDVDLPEAPLGQTLEKLAQSAGIPITCDCPLSGNFQDTPTYALAGRQLRLDSVLDHLLTPLGLGYTIRDQELVVMSKAWSKENLRTRLYRVDDLLKSGKWTIDGFRRWAWRNLEPDYWDEMGGPGVVSVTGLGWLAVTADVTHHRMVEAWHQRERARNGPPTARDFVAIGLSISNGIRRYPEIKLPVELVDVLADHDGSPERVLLVGTSRLATFPLPPKPPVPDPFADDPFAP
ncbi:MAG TPA: hypothetical protein VFV87_21935 [Pirellulaceae bacterium]|nr:hypothetical protein [Pirellulaceae bacterium]